MPTTTKYSLLWSTVRISWASFGWFTRTVKEPTPGCAHTRVSQFLTSSSCRRPEEYIKASFAGASLETQTAFVSHSPTAGLKLSNKRTLVGLQGLGSQGAPSTAQPIRRERLTRILNRALNLIETANRRYGVFPSSGESGACN